MAEVYLNQFNVNGVEYPIRDALSVEALMHRNIYREKNLGSVYTADQKSTIGAGKFEDLYVGDFWVINGITWRIADFDYWYNKGDTPCTTHHVVIVPDKILHSTKMHNTNDTKGGYTGSDFYTGENGNTGRADAITKVQNAFGAANLVTHKKLLVNAATDGKATDWAWQNSIVDLMNESMVYGHEAWAGHPGYETAEGMTQLALFRLNPTLICTRESYWLRDVATATSFAIVGGNGHANSTGASYSLGVRPAFAVA